VNSGAFVPTLGIAINLPIKFEYRSDTPFPISSKA
jgi:hypothetical protein